MTFIQRACGCLCIVLAMAITPATAQIQLYNQNFENPTGFVNDGGDICITRTVNQLYGNQPAGFQFFQNFTVETLLITGTQAFGTGYSDPQLVGGNHCLGMLATLQNDLLGLSFNVQGNPYLNFFLDISSIDLDRFSGPFNPISGAIPVFEIRLYDNPTGLPGLSGNGTLLDTKQITGAPSTSRSVFNWTQQSISLNADASTNDNVTVRIDLMNTGYAAMDNFRIFASPATVPEPGILALVGLAACVGGALAWRRRRNNADVPLS
jgi:hypothetical protein